MAAAGVVIRSMNLLVWMLVLVVSGVCSSENGKLNRLFYNANLTIVGHCFRLTNATHQIGCSSDGSHTRGVLYYVEKWEDVALLQQNGSHAPYVVLLEPELFTGDNVRQLKSMEPTVKGIVVRFDANSTAEGGVFLNHSSPVKKCPNQHTDTDSCEQGDWNEDGTDLLFTDFGNFPIFLIGSEDFDFGVECYNQHNKVSGDGYGDFPLCSVELASEMAAAIDTPTCLRRENLPIPYLNGESYCDPLGDLNVWGSLFNLTESNTNDIIMLTTKLDSVSFFPTGGSFGASSEVAAIATLLAVIQQFGALKRNVQDLSLTRQILYTFFQGESWENIGSSRMAYDMSHDEGFPERKLLPRISLGNIGHFIELGQLGLISDGTIYVHGNKSSEFIGYLTEVGKSVNITVKNSTRPDLPPASLRSFLNEGVKDLNSDFSGSVLTSFNDKFQNRFFGSRFDDINNFGGRSVSEVVEDLAAVATAVARAVFNISGPRCGGVSCQDVEEAIVADEGLIKDVLTCFLYNSSCDFFQSVLVRGWKDNLPQGPLSRYVTAENYLNIETLITSQLVANFTASNATELTVPVKCSDCLKRIKKLFDEDKKYDPRVNVTWIPYNNSNGGSLCLCIQSFTYTHTATSPLFGYKLDYANQKYSSWTESVWSPATIRFYLVTYPLQEVGFFFVGFFLTALSLLVSIQCTRKGTAIFQTSDSYSLFATT